MKQRTSKRIFSMILTIVLIITMLLPDNYGAQVQAAVINGPNLLKNADFQDNSDSLVEKADNNGWDVYAANWGGGPTASVVPSSEQPEVEPPVSNELQSPVLTEDNTNNVTGNPIELTFSDNETWRNKITSIAIDEVEITTGPAITATEKAVILPGKIILDQSLFSMQESQTSRVFTITVNADGYHAAQAKQIVTRTKSEWNLVWDDDFIGTTLDTSKWSYQTGIKANPDGPVYWGNNEKQYYTKENVVVQDGKLIIEAKNDGHDGMPYTSSRIRTITDDKTKLFTTKFGKIEAKIKLPKGQGFWPAFWMLPADDTYGTWAASGEIDIMEARGQEPNWIDGTIHYGETWPNNTYSGGRYTFDQGTDMNDFHIYSIEWEPGEIRWYADGELYSTKNRWYSKGTEEAENYTYPAPFDEEFYILLNLAVGGNYVNNLEPSASDFKTPATMEVDYVRVYQKDAYDTNVTEPEAEKDTVKFAAYKKDADGSFISDRNFDTINTAAILNGKLEDTSGGQNGEARFPLGRWFFATQTDFGASATLTKEVKEEKTFARINFANGGNQTYSTQLIQYMSLAKGYTYEIAFDAKAESPRTINAKAGGNVDAGFPSYSPSFEAALTTKLQHYSYKFTMTENSQDKARLEFNLGIDTNAVTIGNVTVKQTEPDIMNEDAAKEPLENGNHIYNGTFDQGTNRRKFWHVVGATANTVNRQMEVDINTISTSIDEIKLYQKGIQLLQKDTYQLTFDASAKAVRNITAKLLSKDGTFVYSEKLFSLTTIPTSFIGEQAFTFTMPEGVTDREAQLVFCLGGENDDVTIDNIKLIRTTNQNVDYTGINLYPILNGDFTIGTTGWTAHQTSLTVENGVLKAAGGNGTNVYDNMVMFENMPLSEAMTYEISFKAKASAAKQIKFTVEDASYAAILEENNYAIGSDLVTYSKTFRVNTTKKYSLKFQIGKVGAFDFYLDDVILQVKDAPLAKPAMIVSASSNVKVGTKVLLNYYGTKEWAKAAKKVYVNETLVPNEKINYGNGTITLDGSIFTKSAAYLIYIKAEGYADTNVVTQTLIASDGNLILNGSFSEKLEPWQGWFKYNEGAGRNVGSVIVENGIAKVFHEWNEGQNWDLQFFQENIALEGGKTYVLSFDAKATVERPIDIEIAVGIPLGKVNLGTKMTNYTLTYQSGADMSAKINFLLGNVTNGDLTTPGSNTDSHYIYFDNIKLIEKGTIDPVDPTAPTVPTNPSIPSNPTPASIAKVEIKDNKTGILEAKVVTGMKTVLTDDTMQVEANIPTEELLKAAKDATKKNPMNVKITIDTDFITKEIDKDKVKSVDITVVIPSSISDNENIKITELILEEKVFKYVKQYKSDISVSVKDEKGKTSYYWIFNQSDLINKNKLKDINLALNSTTVEDNEDILKLVKSDNKNIKGKNIAGVVVDFNHSGELPSASIVTIYIADRFGIYKNKEIYLYYYNEKTKKFDELPTKKVKVGSDGSITLPIIHCSRYVILPSVVGNKVKSSLIMQVSVSPVKKTLYVGGSTNVKITLPETIDIVNRFTEQSDTLLATTEAKVSYISSNPEVAIISKTGKITAKKIGKTIISTRVLLKDGTKKIYKTTITIKDNQR